MVRKRLKFLSGVGPEHGISQRRLRIGEGVRHTLSGILRRGECRDPALRDASIAVTEVRFSPDLRNATVFVMPLNGANATEIVAGLKRGTPFLKRIVAHEVAFRCTPDLKFELDISFDQADRIAGLLARPDVERDLSRGGARPETHDDVG